MTVTASLKVTPTVITSQTWCTCCPSRGSEVMATVETDGEQTDLGVGHGHEAQEQGHDC